MHIYYLRNSDYDEFVQKSCLTNVSLKITLTLFTSTYYQGRIKDAVASKINVQFNCFEHFTFTA